MVFFIPLSAFEPDLIDPRIPLMDPEALRIPLMDPEALLIPLMDPDALLIPLIALDPDLIIPDPDFIMPDPDLASDAPDFASEATNDMLDFCVREQKIYYVSEAVAKSRIARDS